MAELLQTQNKVARAGKNAADYAAEIRERYLPVSRPDAPGSAGRAAPTLTAGVVYQSANPAQTYTHGQLTGPFYPRGAAHRAETPEQAVRRPDTWVFVNGIYNDSEGHRGSAQHLADVENKVVVGVFNQSDAVKAVRDDLGVGGNAAIARVRDLILARPALHIVGHSDGSLVTAAALWEAQKKHRLGPETIADFIGSQVADAPRGPTYLRLIDDNDWAAIGPGTAFTSVHGYGLLGKVIAGQPVAEADILGATEILNKHGGHGAEHYMDALEDARRRHARHSPGLLRDTLTQTYLTIGAVTTLRPWLMHDYVDKWASDTWRAAGQKVTRAKQSITDGARRLRDAAQQKLQQWRGDIVQTAAQAGAWGHAASGWMRAQARRVWAATPNDGDLTGPFLPHQPYPDVPLVSSMPTPTMERALGKYGSAAIFVNGVNTSLDAHCKAAQRLADVTGSVVLGVYNATGVPRPVGKTGLLDKIGAAVGGLRDLGQSLDDKMTLGRGNAATTKLVYILGRYGRSRKITIYAHSQGTIITADALWQARRGGNKLSGYEVTTFGNAAFLYPEGPNYHHYASDSDLVPTLVGTNSLIGAGSRALWNMPGSRWMMERIYGAPAARQSATLLHSSGAWIDPHDVNSISDPARLDTRSVTLDYMGRLQQFREAEARREREHLAPPSTVSVLARTSLATTFAMGRGAAGIGQHLAASEYDALSRQVRALTPRPLSGVWDQTDWTLRGAGSLLTAGGAGAAHAIDGWFEGWDSGSDKLSGQNSDGHTIRRPDKLSGAHSAKAQRQGRGAEWQGDAAQLRARLLRTGGNGTALPQSLRALLGPALGFDPHSARLHHSPATAGVARELNAEAFTIGRDVFFGAGKYRPLVNEGVKLLAHELTHVGQQSGLLGSRAQFHTPHGGDVMEREAQQTAAQAPVQTAARLRVATYSRQYHVEENGELASADRERLERLSMEALQYAERALPTNSASANARLTTLNVDVSLDLKSMSDEEILANWSRALIASITAATGSVQDKWQQGTGSAGPPNAATGEAEESLGTNGQYSRENAPAGTISDAHYTPYSAVSKAMQRSPTSRDIVSRPSEVGRVGPLDPKNAALYEKYKAGLSAQEIIEAPATGSALKPDVLHRSASWTVGDVPKEGQHFSIRSGDGTWSNLTQVEGELNGERGIYEWIVNKRGQLTHQRFVRGGRITGFPNQAMKQGRIMEPAGRPQVGPPPAPREAAVLPKPSAAKTGAGEASASLLKQLEREGTRAEPAAVEAAETLAGKMRWPGQVHSVFRYGGKLFIVVAIASDAYEIYRAKDHVKALVTSAGGWGGAAAAGAAFAAWWAPADVAGPWAWLAHGAGTLISGGVGYWVGTTTTRTIYELVLD